MKIFRRLFSKKSKEHPKKQDADGNVNVERSDDDEIIIEDPVFVGLYDGMFSVDLKLPSHKTPLDLATFREIWTPLPSQRLVDAQLPNNLTYAIGSAKKDDEIYYQRDTGLFQCIHEAWINHWNLRTTPEDWWFPIACKISKTLADVTMSTNGVDPSMDEYAQKMRDFLIYLSSERETIAVDVPVDSIYDANYERIFDEISLQLHNSIKVPELVQVMTNDFSTSTTCHKIASQVNLMSGLQHCFDYQTDFTACGIRGVEMLGTQQDWDNLDKKLTKVRALLKDIEEETSWYLPNEWWEEVSLCFQNLALTYKGGESNESRRVVGKFWNDIIIPTKVGNRVDNKYDKGPRTHTVEAFEGWLVYFLTGRSRTTRGIRVQDIIEHPKVQEEFHGLNTVPMTVRCLVGDEVGETVTISDKAEVVAGIMGFELHEGDTTFNEVPSLQPYHVWALMFPLDSPILAKCGRR